MKQNRFRILAFLLSAVLLLSLCSCFDINDWLEKKLTGMTEDTSTETDSDSETDYSETECTHQFAESVVAPTCETEGYTEYTCGLCGYSYRTGQTEALGHDYSIIVESSAACSSEGGYTIYKCNRCNSIYEDRDTQTAGHLCSVWTVEVAATCTESGTETSVCTRCGEVVTRDIAPLGHAFGDPVTQTEASCTASGVALLTCTRCGLEETVTTAATGHSWQYALPAEGGHSFEYCRNCHEGYQDGCTDVPVGNSVYGYDSLENLTQGAAMQKLYVSMLQQAVEYQEAVTAAAVSGSCLAEISFNGNNLSSDNAKKAYKAFNCDGAWFYWLDKITLKNIGASFTIQLIPDETYTDASYRRNINKQLDTLISSLLSAADEKDTDYDKAAALYHAMNLSVDYAFQADGVTPMSTSQVHGIVGFVEGQRVVCEGYAQMLQILMNSTGIPCIFVSGVSNAVNHAWNMIQLNGEWFNVDATYDDVGDSFTMMKYFCMSESEFKDLHLSERPSDAGTDWLYELPTVSGSRVTPVTVLKNDTETARYISIDAALQDMHEALSSYTIILDGEVYSDEQGADAFSWDYRIATTDWPQVASITLKGSEVVWSSNWAAALTVKLPDTVTLHSALILDCVSLSAGELNIGDNTLLLSSTVSTVNYDITGTSQSQVYFCGMTFMYGDLSAGTLQLQQYTELDGKMQVNLLIPSGETLVLNGSYDADIQELQINGIVVILLMDKVSAKGHFSLNSMTKTTGGTAMLRVIARIVDAADYPEITFGSAFPVETYFQIESETVVPGSYSGALYTLTQNDTTNFHFQLSSWGTVTPVTSGNGVYRYAS